MKFLFEILAKKFFQRFNKNMRISFNTLKPINTNYPANNNLYYSNNNFFNNTLVADTFCSTVSFGCDEIKFEKADQEKINAANMNDRDSRTRLYYLKNTKKLTIDDAILCIDLNESEVEKFIQLSTSHKDLNAEDKIGLISYKIENIKRYKEVKQNFNLEIYEALLVTKFDLDDMQIQKYLSRKGSSISYRDDDSNIRKYTPTDDEWIICIKENFHNKQLRRLAQIKNRTIDFKDDTVRRTGGNQSYPFFYIVDCVKKGKSDQDIEKDYKIIENLDISNFTYDQIDNYRRIKKSGIPEDMAYLLVKLYDQSIGKKVGNVRHTNNVSASNGTDLIVPFYDENNDMVNLSHFLRRVLYQMNIFKAIKTSDTGHVVSPNAGLYDLGERKCKISTCNNTGLSDEQLVKTTNYKFVTSELFDKLPEDFWYMITMGCKEEQQNIMRKAIRKMSSKNPEKNFQSSPLRCVEVKSSLGNYDSGDYTYNKANGDFKLKSPKPFEVNISKGLINQKPVLIIKDKNSSNQYISYNGAIAKVQNASPRNYRQFMNWGNLLPQKQAEILAKAANGFVFDLFDSKTKDCIIGKKSPTSKMNTKTDRQIDKYYGKKLLELKNDNKLTPENILKIMPKNGILSISPYIQDGNILYAIVTEWFSKDGNRWQMEIHSQNWKYDNDNKWIFRLHNETSDTVRHYFRYVGNQAGYDFNGGFLDANAHIKIDSPLKQNDLLNNVEFQKIISQISSNLCKDYTIWRISDNLRGTRVENDSNATMDNIIDYCLRNVTAFVKYKNEILQFRAQCGKPDLT